MDEFVVAGGLISQETVQFYFNNYQNIKLIPPRDYVVNNLRTDTNYNWLIFGGLWGHWNSLPTAGANNLIFKLVDFVTEIYNLVPFAPDIEIPLENIAPLSPYRGSLQP